MANYRVIIPGDIYANCKNEFYKVHYLAKNVENDEILVIYSRLDERENILASSHVLFIEKGFKLISSGRNEKEKTPLFDIKQAKELLYPNIVVVKRQ